MESITSQYMENLAAMGYSVEFKEKVVKSALVGYQRILFKVEEGRSRQGKDTFKKRRFQKLCGISQWLRPDTDTLDEQEPAGVFFEG